MGMAQLPVEHGATRPAGGSGHPFDIGDNERRMHVRAYNYWVSLLDGRAYPSIEDLEPADLASFEANSVLLDFSIGVEDPAIQYLGRALREECGVETSIRHISQVPSRSLLSRLTDHYLQIIANCAPIGFEAEFVGRQGRDTLYRGILMPFSSDGDTIDFIYGVINWKVTVDDATQVRLSQEVEAARRDLSREAAVPAPAAWADGPSVGLEHAVVVTGSTARKDSGLCDLLAHARACAEDAAAADSRSHAALYHALDRAYAFAHAASADPHRYAELLEDAGLKVQTRAPMTPVVKLVFGAHHDKTRLTEYAAVLMHARRKGVAAGAFAAFLRHAEGGIKGIVAAERALRRPNGPAALFDNAAAELRRRAVIATVPIEAGDEEFVLLVARAGTDGMLEVVARVEGEDAMMQKAVCRAGA